MPQGLRGQLLDGHSSQLITSAVRRARFDLRTGFASRKIGLVV